MLQRLTPSPSVADFSPRAIFAHFPSWHSAFDWEGQTLGGAADHRSSRISMLNLPDLARHVDLAGKSVLEMGPLEGGNPLLLARRGVSRIVAVEGRVENHVKCCVVKNLFRLDNAHFALDDVRDVSAEIYGRFDVALVAGILYHLDDPHVLLEKLNHMTERMVVATHFADETSPSPEAEIRTLATPRGTYRWKVYREGPLADINSGLQATSFWPFEEDLLAMLRDAGFAQIDVLQRDPDPTERYRVIHLVARKR